MFTRGGASAAFAIALFAGGGPAATAAAGRLPSSAASIADYSISVSLDPEAKTLAGRQRLVWRNPSADAVPDLWFHLYLNAFRNNRSTFYLESGGRLRGDRAPRDGWGWIDLTELRLADPAGAAAGVDLLPALTFEHPDDDNEDDRTVARVALPAPVPAGGEIALDIAWTAKLPKVYARTGHYGDFFAVAQWYPKLAVYEPAGRRGRATGGWNCHQFHANSEFYADYGRYRVEMTVPEEFVVGATGPRVGARSNGDGTSTYVHEQADVHDFVWTADPNFVEIVEKFDAAKEVSPEEVTRTARLLDRPEDEIRLSDVEIRLLLQPSHRPQAERHLRAARIGLKWFGLWYGAYPYPTLTIVDPPGDAGGASGVEYPTLFFAGTSYDKNFWPFSGVHEAEFVTMHELGHQYWYGLVGSNEFEEAWLDEGFNTYSTAKAMDLGFGAEGSAISFLGLYLGSREVDQLGNFAERRVDRLASPSWQFARGQYGFNSYSRPALVLATLEGILGETTMARVMRTYHERFRFGHPSGADFFAVASEVSGRDLAWFFDQVVLAPGVFDPAVAAISSARVPAFRGRDESRPSPAMVRESEAEASERDPEASEKRPYRSVVELRLLGEVRLPVEVELLFENRPAERRLWEGPPVGRNWDRWTIESPDRLLAAEIDPDGKLPLDANRLNNAQRISEDPAVARAWAFTAHFWLARALAWMGL